MKLDTSLSPGDPARFPRPGLNLENILKAPVKKSSSPSSVKRALSDEVGFEGQGLMKPKGLTGLKERLAQQRPRFKKTS